MSPHCRRTWKAPIDAAPKRGVIRHRRYFGRQTSFSTVMSELSRNSLTKAL
jgi:hypothetical protein